jgi:hypothetical protein
LVAGIFATVTVELRIWPMAIASAVFVAGAYATAVTAYVLAKSEKSAVEQRLGNVQSNKSTFAIVVLLISIYSSMLVLGLAVFDAFFFNAFFKNGPGSFKYYLTVGIAIVATLYMQVYGKHVVREHFGRQGGRNLELAPNQVWYVALFLMALATYGAWLFF